MSNSCIARLAREVSEKIIADDPMVMAGDKLNGRARPPLPPPPPSPRPLTSLSLPAAGEQLYDTRKLTNVVHSTVETVLDEHRAAGTIEAEEAAKAKRYLVDIFTSRGACDPRPPALLPSRRMPRARCRHARRRPAPLPRPRAEVQNGGPARRFHGL